MQSNGIISHDIRAGAGNHFFELDRKISLNGHDFAEYEQTMTAQTAIVILLRISLDEAEYIVVN
ncbi:hypothetical protein [Kosakonia cowanii]|jgi:hypothetical protein|uniref:hypothetical protein n=1 Tax=Kosakonia cowanii TaxID=208223 RepID=UPI0025A9ACF3|nr:hypothetical protein [Kosakonia cowanii]WPG20077.1 hypothetical protein SD435_17590 [Kosakonia cowanii]WRY58542.1 hypothetical protein P8F81_18190 [Kosakonia cowanii]